MICKGILIQSSTLIRILSGGMARGMAIFPFILVRDEFARKDEVLIFHEQIHLHQQIEMGLFLFYIWYFIEYLIRRFQYRNHRLAYRNISFEREAYVNQHNLKYLEEKSFWSFLKFIKL